MIDLLQRLLNKVNRVTAYHRHGNPIPERALDELANRQIEIEQSITQYRHYKGGVYTYICDAMLEWDRECHVIIYADEQGNRWVRPRVDFFGYTEVDGKQVRRFEKIEDDQS